LKRLLLTSVLTGLCVVVAADVVLAQRTVSATARFRIASPASIREEEDMSFGDMDVEGAAGTVTLRASDGSLRPSGGVALPRVTGPVNRAAFRVEGESNYLYAITLPSGDYVVKEQFTEKTMVVNDFVTSPPATGTLTAGAQLLLVGATLHVGTSPNAGVYTNTSGFDVTVNYN
jgi:spore coat protein U-like protein